MDLIRWCQDIPVPDKHQEVSFSPKRCLGGRLQFKVAKKEFVHCYYFPVHCKHSCPRPVCMARNKLFSVLPSVSFFTLIFEIRAYITMDGFGPAFLVIFIVIDLWTTLKVNFGVEQIRTRAEIIRKHPLKLETFYV